MLILYIDPGTGAIILQVIVAGVMTVGVFFRHTLPESLRRLFGRRRGRPVGSQDEDPDARD